MRGSADDEGGGTVKVLLDAQTGPDCLAGVRLAAREMGHLLNNDLAPAVAQLELLRRRGDLPPQLRPILDDVAAGLDAAVRHVAIFQRVRRVATKETPVGPALDLERSAGDRW